MNQMKVNLNLLTLFIQVLLITADWIELPMIAPPTKNIKNQGSLTTITSRQSTVKSKGLLKPSTDSRNPLTDPNESTHDTSRSYIQSYEDIGPSVELGNKYQPRPWKTKPLSHRNPFNNWGQVSHESHTSHDDGSTTTTFHYSGGLSHFTGNSSSLPKRPSVDTKKYYRWRNASYSKVQAHPSIGDSVDYTIINPDVISTESNEDTPVRYSYPKTVIISSKTPLLSHFPEATTKGTYSYTPYTATIDTKVDDEILTTTDSIDRFDVTVETPVEETDEEGLQHDEDDHDEMKWDNDWEDADDLEYDDEVDDGDEYDEEDGGEEEADGTNDTNNPSESVEKKFHVTASPLQPPPTPVAPGGFMGFLQFLKNIQQKLSFAPSTPVEKKVNYLQYLSDKATGELSKYDRE